MGRDISTDLAAILAQPTRKLDWTLDITLPDASVHRFATSPLTISGNSYVNDVEGIREIRQTFGGPIDKVGLTFQNVDSVLGLAIVADIDLWRRAEVVVGRYYQSEDGSLTAWISMFSGAFQQPAIVDLTVTTDVVSDVASAGLIVATRTCAPQCGFKFKDLATCGYSGLLTNCNHLLKSTGGCDGRANSHHFGGCEHRYQITTNVPGTGGNSGGGGTRDCPRLDQFIRVRGPKGDIVPRIVGSLTLEDWLWDPIERGFFPIHTARVIKNVPIWERRTAVGAGGFSSSTHRVMPNKDHSTGLPVEMLRPDDDVLSEVNWKYGIQIVNDTLRLSQPTGELGDVMYIEMAGGHHYASGDSPDGMTVDHNNKLQPVDL